MNVFDLLAKISLDTSEYESGLKNASNKSSSLSEGLGKAAKVGAAAIGAATTAVAAFSAKAVMTGKDFDASMSQVAATMGKTVDEIEDLRKFAQEMGASTSFSATQAADALNYMALAGYDAETSMNMLPNVLNLAAAGGIELAQASDMVTDAQSALGLSLDETSDLVDKMAMASSKSNTSVAQLGEAILTIGGTAKNVAGGTTELSTALGILADNGIKGGEGGTALRNIILSLSAPTDKAATAMKSLGLEAYDADGNLRPLNDIFNDLNGTLSTMTQGEQTEVLNEMFNKVDLKSVNALLANSGERFDELSGYIDEAQGSAQKMADTQLDNLQGDLTLLASAFEGVQIALSDKLTPTIRTFVKMAGDGLGEVTKKLQAGDWSGAFNVIGKVATEAITKLTQSLPQMIEAGISLIGALGQGIMDNAPVILQAALDTIKVLADGLISGLPNLIPAVVDIILQITDTLLDNMDMLIDVSIDLIMALADGLINALPILIEKTPIIIVKFVDGIVRNLPKIMEASQDIMLKLAEGVVNNVPKLVEKVPMLVNAFINAWKAQASMIIQIGRGIIDFVKDGINDAYTAFTSTVIGWVNNAIAFLGSLWGSVTSIGQNIVEGIWAGISNGYSWITNKISGWVGNVLDFFKKKLGIASPSKVMRDEVGHWLAAGLWQGFDDYDAFGKINTSINGSVSDMKTNISSASNAPTLAGFDYDRLGQAVSDAIANVGIELDSREMGRFVRKAVSYA